MAKARLASLISPTSLTSRIAASDIEVVRAAVKYKLPRVVREMRPFWNGHIVKSPLDLYFSAIKWGLLSEAEACAYELVKAHGKVASVAQLYVAQMEEATTEEYHNLLIYAARCFEAAIDDTLWPESVDLQNPPSWLKKEVVSSLRDMAVRNKRTLDSVASQTPGGLLFLGTAITATTSSSLSRKSYEPPPVENRIGWSLAFLDQLS
ncbi:uncharacterized protein BXZ73DRAFT_106783 [Epithele typhae]|uniref:uncharacterized protein n=1 Tax=Epithele typhae TaxID=378194 RepID=UPI002007507E|nr:uncharacterized protein BXZ73DRAFT_106783 [Epithele typhae]KAH9914001.1 hypothetical protein BXZ73DRAFT_106783 [Epithele typhae]